MRKVVKSIDKNPSCSQSNAVGLFRLLFLQTVMVDNSRIFLGTITDLHLAQHYCTLSLVNSVLIRPHPVSCTSPCKEL